MIDADGWLHTGDVGHVDADGWLFVVDRVKELIKYKGFQVAPAELEAVCSPTPAIADAAVVGIPDEEAGEVPEAFVVRRRRPDLDAEGIRRSSPSASPPTRRCARVELTDRDPQIRVRQILRRLLVERGARERAQRSQPRAAGLGRARRARGRVARGPAILGRAERRVAAKGDLRRRGAA